MGSNCLIEDGILKVTQVAGGQRGVCYKVIDVDDSAPIDLAFDMYVGDGSGADGVCANIGNNDLGGRVAENGVTQGFAYCFDEWSNGSTESGIKIFYNAGTQANGDGHGCENGRNDCHVFVDFADCGGRNFIQFSPAGNYRLICQNNTL
jgi:hypothetical protein